MVNDHLMLGLLSLLSCLSLFNLLGLLGELQLGLEVLLTLLVSLISIRNLLDRAEAHLGELEGSLGGTLTMSSIHSVGPVLDVAPEVGGVAGKASLEVVVVMAALLVPQMTVQEDGLDVGS